MSESIQETLKKNDDIIKSMIATVNGERKLNKNKWYIVTVVFKDYSITFKGYNTWIQRVKINGHNTFVSSSMDLKVSEFKEFLYNLFESIEFGNYKQYRR